MNVVIFLGPPGSGKGTQARLLSHTLNLALVGMGDLLRDEIDRKTAEGLAIEGAVQKGEMPNWSIVRTVFQRYLHTLTHNFVIFDGVPRNEEQVKDVENMLALMGASVAGVFFLDVPHSVLVDRMTNRLQCSECGMSYTQELLQAKNKCDFCESDHFVKREDDQEVVIRKRLEIYSESIAPLMDHYKRKNILTIVDGTLPVVDVQKQIIDCLGFDQTVCRA